MDVCAGETMLNSLLMVRKGFGGYLKKTLRRANRSLEHATEDDVDTIHYFWRWIRLIKRPAMLQNVHELALVSGSWGVLQETIAPGRGRVTTHTYGGECKFSPFLKYNMKRSSSKTPDGFYTDIKVPRCLKSRLPSPVIEMAMQVVISSIKSML